VGEIVLERHELFNGSGYPAELSGEDILLEARVINLANTVEAVRVLLTGSLI